MFVCFSRLPSCAPGHVPSRGSKSQVTAGIIGNRVIEFLEFDNSQDSAQPQAARKYIATNM